MHKNQPSYIRKKEREGEGGKKKGERIKKEKIKKERKGQNEIRKQYHSQSPQICIKTIH